MNPKWLYDEFRHLGVDFANPAEVAAYDARQGTSVERERSLVQRLGITAGMTVVEFGTGTGAFALAAAETGARVIAADVSPAMLAYARQRAAGRDNIEFVHASFLTYEHAGAPVDVLVTKAAFHHLPDFWKAVALHRLHQLLRPGGKLFLWDVVFSFATAEYRERLEEWIAAVAREDGRGFSRAAFEQHIREEHSTFAWIIEEMLRREGFHLVEAHHTAPTYAEYLCQRRD